MRTDRLLTFCLLLQSVGHPCYSNWDTSMLQQGGYIHAASRGCIKGDCIRGWNITFAALLCNAVGHKQVCTCTYCGFHNFQWQKDQAWLFISLSTLRTEYHLTKDTKFYVQIIRQIINAALESLGNCSEIGHAFLSSSLPYDGKSITSALQENTHGPVRSEGGVEILTLVSSHQQKERFSSNSGAMLLEKQMASKGFILEFSSVPRSKFQTTLLILTIHSQLRKKRFGSLNIVKEGLTVTDCLCHRLHRVHLDILPRGFFTKIWFVSLIDMYMYNFQLKLSTQR